MFEITRGIPEPLLIEARRLGRPQNMAGLDWKSDAVATVIHPLLEGNGVIRLNGIGGVKFKTRIENSIRVFC